ncbi:hypothetical protein TNCV_4315621 [Trichonephila clavipes]|nr:hypothetical protein TNCV_4315621 [Trichonephila clavipes]
MPLEGVKLRSPWSTNQVLGTVDRRDVIYTVTRLRTPSVDQSSRRPSHHTTRMRRATCLIGAVQKQAESSIRNPMSSRTTAKHLAEGHLVSRGPLRVLPMTPTH